MIRTLVIHCMVAILSFSEWHKNNCDHNTDTQYVSVDESRMVKTAKERSK